MASSKAKTFNYDSLAEIDKGKIKAMVQHAMDRCIDDIRASPKIGRARDANIKLSFKPETTVDGLLTGITLTVGVSDTAPGKQTPHYPLINAGAAVHWDPSVQLELID